MLKITQFKWEKPKGKYEDWYPYRHYVVKNSNELYTLFCSMIFPFANFKDTEEFCKYSKMTFKTEADRYDFYFQRYSEWIDQLIYDFNMSCDRMLPEFDCFDWTRCSNPAPNNWVKLIVEVV